MALFETCHNYYEHLVYAHIHDTLMDSAAHHDDQFLEDVACVALNQLPARYVREDVDTSFFLSEGEMEHMEVRVNDAVQRALKIVTDHPQGPYFVDQDEA